VTAADGIEYAYREAGEGGVPLLLLTHFRGNLDNWDPALVDALAADRRGIAFDKAADEKALGRMFSRSDPDTPTTWRTRQAQYDAVCAWGVPDVSLLGRAAAIRIPVFVANGDSDR
jgi:pimeloyl-ACP methyl ester carboxylesterase